MHLNVISFRLLIMRSPICCLTSELLGGAAAEQAPQMYDQKGVQAIKESITHPEIPTKPQISHLWKSSF